MIQKKQSECSQHYKFLVKVSNISCKCQYGLQRKTERAKTSYEQPTCPKKRNCFWVGQASFGDCFLIVSDCFGLFWIFYLLMFVVHVISLISFQRDFRVINVFTQPWHQELVACCIKSAHCSLRIQHIPPIFHVNASTGCREKQSEQKLHMNSQHVQRRGIVSGQVRHRLGIVS